MSEVSVRTPASGQAEARDAGRASAPAAGRPAASATGDGGWLLPLAVLVVGMFMSTLDTSIVNVAIPTIQNQFGGTTDQVQWISTAYTLTLGVVVPLSGWLGDRFGLGSVYTLSLLGFTVGSALCGLAWSLDVLIGFRILQAIGGGVLPVVAMAMLYRVVPRERLGTAMGIYGLGVIFGPAIGPTLGGYLVEYVDWRLIFYINVPVGILGAIASVVVLPKFPRKPGQTFDFAGFVTVAAGLFALLLAFSEGQSWGWTSYAIMMLFVGGLLSLAAFVVIELEVAEPMLDVRIFKYWPFTNSLLVGTVVMVGLYGVVFYVPLFLQEGQGLGAFQAGLTLLPASLVMGALMPISGRIYDRFGARWPGAIGLLIVAYASYLMHGMQIDTPKEQMTLWMAIRNLGLGLGMMPIMTSGLAVIPTEKTSRASAVNNIARQVASALGLAVLTSLVTAQEAQMYADRAGLLTSGNRGFPQLQEVISRGALGVYGLYQQTQLQVFAAAVDDLFLLTAGLTVLAIPLALMLRSGPAKAAAPAPAAPARQAPAGAGVGAAGNGPVGNGAAANGAAAKGHETGKAEWAGGDGRTPAQAARAAGAGGAATATLSREEPADPPAPTLPREGGGSSEAAPTGPGEPAENGAGGQPSPTAPGRRRRLGRGARGVIALIALVAVAAGGVFGYSYLSYARNFVSTDNAQIDGDQIVVTAPATGTLMDWQGGVGATFQRGQVIGRVQIPNGFVKPQMSIRAPADGTVALSNAVDGAWVTQGSTLATAYNLADIYVTARVQETDINSVRPGQAVDISVDAYPGAKLTGHVQEVEGASAGTFSLLPQNNSSGNFQKVTQNVPVRIQIDDSKGLYLVPGMSVTANIHKH
jgi:EmrB/QacA subfamily drug resistance transporter